jgi:hypothetical protein
MSTLSVVRSSIYLDAVYSLEYCATLTIQITKNTQYNIIQKLSLSQCKNQNPNQNPKLLDFNAINSLQYFTEAPGL